MSFSDYLLNKMIPETNASTSFLWSPQGEEGQSKWIKMQVCTVVFFLKRAYIQIFSIMSSGRSYF